MRLAKIGFKLDGSLEGRDRAVEITKFLKRVAKAAIKKRMPWHDLKRLPDQLHPVRGTPGLRGNDSQHVKRIGAMGVFHEDLPVGALGPGRMSSLQESKAVLKPLAEGH